MASILKVDTLTGKSTAGSIAVTGEGNSTTTNLQQGLCKAWVHVHNNASIDDSFNISAYEDTGTGSSQITYTNNMGNDDYVGSGLARETSSGGDAFLRFSGIFSTSQTKYFCRASGSSLDGETQTMLTHGDLA